MVIIVKHRVNTIEELQKTPTHLGIEIDIRPYKDRLILEHAPYIEGEDFKEFLNHYKHQIILANIKSEGIEKDVIAEFEKRGISNYFIFDTSFATLVELTNQGFSKIASRFSEYEDISTSLKLQDKVEWVFIDNFTTLPTFNDAFTTLKKAGLKLCIVSPELLDRNELEKTKQLLKKYPVDAILTKNPTLWL